MRYTKSALGLLNAQYRSVLKKCLLINLGLFALAAISATPAMATSNVVITVGTTTANNVATTENGTTVNGSTSINSVNNAGNTTVEVYSSGEVNTLLNNKVDAVAGKGLSSNDFTNDYKTAIDNLATTYQTKLANGDVTKAMLSEGVQTTLNNADTLYAKLGNVTATADEINKLAGNAVTAADLTKLSQVTADKDELNILDGATLSTDELNVLDGITATTANLNVLTGVTGKDTAGIAASVAGSDTVLATTQSVVNTITNQAQDATFTPTAANLAAVTIKGALNELGAENAVQNTIIGAAMNANGTANTSALTSKNFAGDAVTNLTAAVNLIGDLSSTGINQNTIAGQIGSITAANIKDRGVGKLISTNSVGANLQLLDTAIGANVTNTTNGVATTKSVNENIDAVNTALGNVAGLGNGTSAEYNGVSGYDATAPGANLTAAVSKLNQNVHNVLGDMYKTDGSFDNSKLINATTQNGFDNDAGNTNLTAALKNYADNVVAATGVSYAADGRVTTAYTRGNANYEALGTGTSLKVAIEKLDSNIGDAMTVTGGSRATTAFQTGASKSVNANLSALDAAIGADMTSVQNRTTGAVAATNTINTNLQQLDAAIGSNADLLTTTVSTNTGDNNGVKVDNSVNRNIAALNAAVGDVSTLKAGTAATGDAITKGTGTAATTVVEAINNIDATLGNIHGLYDGSTVNASVVTSTVNGHSNLAKGTTVEDHLVTLDNAVGDRTLTSLNNDIDTAMSGTSLAAGLQAAGNAIGDANFASTKYASGDRDLSSAIRSLDNNIYRIDREVSDLKHDFRAGMASMAAMTALVPNARSQGDTSLSLGTGAYEGHTAMAIGGFHYINDNLLLNAGVSWSNTSDAAYRMGITYSF